jgi:hypothetical protein
VHPCPGCGQERHQADERLRGQVRSYWSKDTDAIQLIEDFERAAEAQGCETFGDKLLSSMREFTATYPPPPEGQG